MVEAFKKLLNDPEISEIMIDGPKLVRIEKRGEVIDTNVRFKTQKDLERLIDSFHEDQKASDENPVRESRLKDGTRVTSVSGKAAVGGPFALIVKPRKFAPTWENFQEWKSLDKDASTLLQAIVSRGNSLLIAGAAWSGVLTMADLLMSSIRPICRVIGIEGRYPLQITDRHPHVILLSARGEMRPWVETAISLRPDAIVTGEVLGPEAYELVRAAQEGTQVLAPLRATSAADALRRFELKCLEANTSWSINEHRAQIAQSFKFITFQDILRGSNNRRLVREITEIVGFEDGKYQLEPLMRWNEKSDRFELTERGRKVMR